MESCEYLYECSYSELIDKLLDDDIIREVDDDNNGYDSPFHTALWDFCRLLRGHPDLRNKSGKEALAIVERRLRDLKRTWFSYGLRSNEDARVEFLDVWDKIRFVPGEPPLLLAFSKARRNPIILPKEFEKTESYKDLLSTAYYLQKAVGDNRRILLPEEKLGELFDCSPMTISRYRDWAKEQGFLIEKTPHSFDRESRKGKATEFVFSFERLAQIQKENSDI
jgi:hypothetical protein